MEETCLFLELLITPDCHEPDNLESLGWEEEIGESPQYSCYKIVDIQFGQQTENLTKVPYQFTFNAAVDTCGDVKGSLPVVMSLILKVMFKKSLSTVSLKISNSCFFLSFLPSSH